MIEWPAAPASPAKASAPSGIGFVFQEPTLMPWTTVFDNVKLPLELHGVSRRNAASARRRGTRARRAFGVSPCLSARIVRRHAHAGLDRPRAGDRAELLLMDEPFAALDEITPLQAQRRSVADVAVAAHHRGVRDPFGFRIRLSVEPHRGDDAAAGQSVHRARVDPPVSARPGFPHLRGICAACCRASDALGQAMAAGGAL